MASSAAVVVALAGGGLAPPVVAEPLPTRAERVADYRIAVSLDPSTHDLSGVQRLVWRNTSGDEVGDLWFHLYLNAFKNNRSSFFRESGGQLRGASASVDEGWGWIDVTAIKLSTGRDLLPDAHFVQPDDDNADDQTVWRVPLPAPVPPGGAVAVDIEFKARLPRVFARTGYARDFHLVGQWFPKLGVYEAAGVRGRESGGWNCHQFHATSEFYADFGDYAVDITVPAGQVVGATGTRTSLRTNPDGSVTHRYEQANVHDFAWTASPVHREIRRTFAAGVDVTAEEYAAAARLLGRRADEVRLSDVEIVLLMHPDHLDQAERYVAAAKLALKHYGLWYGAYPFGTLTIVDPPPGGEGAGGMEYPTFITAGTSALFSYWPFDRIYLPEAIVAHEVAHQFWHGLVANNEFEEAWLDEGLATYAEGKLMDLAFGSTASTLRLFGFSVSTLDVWRLENRPWRIFDAVLTSTWDYISEESWAFNSYTKPALVLRTLEGLIGEESMARVLRTFQERWRFAHPSSTDFFEVVRDVAEGDWRAFLRQTIEQPEILDYEVAAIESRRERPLRGYVDEPSGRVLRGPGAAGNGDDADEDDQDEVDPEGLFESTVTLRRRGGVVAPVVLEVKFAGQEPERYDWDGAGRWHRLDFVRPTRLEWATIDPDRRLVLDVQRANNSRRLEPDRRVGISWAAQCLFWMQNLVAWVGI